MRPFDLYRRRLIPKECILLGDDTMISFADDCLITTWSALRPKKNLHHGISAFFFDDGIKVSKFYREDNSLVYWYIDIIRADLCFTEGGKKPEISDAPYDISFDNYPVPDQLGASEKEAILHPIETAMRLYETKQQSKKEEDSAFSPSLIVTDLLADILIYPDGFVKVVDLDEISEALEKGLLTQDCVAATLRIVDQTLRQIYDGSFAEKQGYLERFEK
ncbi:MAG: YgaC family protein [Lachnospiraceae bacterium]|nr:YgaC family protein [Lachnospiraceae bacterium]